MKIFLAVLFACASAVALAAESGVVVRASQLLAAPYSDADSRGILRGEAQVEILERRGGWYHVRSDDGRDGWLRLSSIRLGQAEEEEEGGFWASLFSFTGRSQMRTASATTGIRGLSEEEINAAEPNPAAVERLATFAPDDADTQRFAAEIGLVEREVGPLPEELPAEARGRVRK